MSEISERLSDMTSATLDEAASLLRKIAGSRQAGESLKAVFRRLGRQLSDWSDSRIKAVWYRDARTVIRAAEVEQLRALAARRDRRRGDSELEELRSTVARLARYEQLLARLDADYGGEEVLAPSLQPRQSGEVLGRRGVRA